jgi:hypothetical protein
MKNSVLFCLLAGLSLGAHAQASPEPLSSVKISIPAPAISLPDQVSVIYSGGFENLLGLYEMSNGQTMRLTMRGIHKYAQVGERPRVEVVSTSDYEFVAVDRQLKINLDEPVFGHTGGTVLLAVPNDDVAAAQVLQRFSLVASK